MSSVTKESSLEEKAKELLSGGGDAIALFKVFMSEEAIEAATKVLRSGFIGQGPYVDAFEERFASCISSPYVLSLNSGTSALHLALRLSNVSYGDEVISTPMTCTATNVPILAHGAQIVWGDIDPSTGALCPKSVAAKITKKTKAIICVDWGGYPCDLEELQQIADDAGCMLIEDAAHAIGACYKDRLVGGIADFTCFSFQAIKHLTTVDGGALVCKRAEDAKRGKLLRWFGIDREGPRKDFRCEADVVEYGYKFHMNDVTAAIGLAQLTHLERLLQAHRRHAAYYDALFASSSHEGLSTLHYRPDRLSSYWLYTIRVKERAAFMQKMQKRGIVVSQVHARNDLHTMFRPFRAELPGVDAFVSEQVSIPVGWWLTDKEVAYIGESAIECSRLSH